MASKQEQEKLIKIIREQDEEGWDIFFGKYEPYVSRIVDKSRFRDVVYEEKHNIVFDTLSEAYKFIRKGTPILNLDWLISKIAGRKTGKYFKDMRYGNPPADEVDETYPDGNPNQEDLVIKKQHLDFINVCMNRLTDLQRLIITMQKEGYTWAEIARAKNVSQASITETRNAAYKRLRKCVNELQQI